MAGSTASSGELSGCSFTPRLDLQLLMDHSVSGRRRQFALEERQMCNKRKIVNRSKNGAGVLPTWGSKGEVSRVSLDERALAVFHLDSLIPHQFYNTFKRTAPLVPERTLMLAILQDAVSVFQNYAGARGRKRRELFLETEEWILATDRTYLFSFENICELLGLNPIYLRQGLMRWKAAAVGSRQARQMAS